MSVYQITLDDKAIVEQIKDILSQVLSRQLLNQYSDTGREISAAVKEIVYSHKDEIIDKVVNRAVTEIVKKGLPRLLERMAVKE